MTPRSTELPAPTPRINDAGSAYLDALRAVAANLVVLSHVVLIFGDPGHRELGASLAVSIFFLLSGFLITQSMLNWQKRPGPRFPGFLADRVARITTPYVPALVLIALANLWFISTHWGAPGVNTGVLPFIGNLLMLQDHSLLRLLEMARVPVPGHVALYNTAEPFWTVSIEMWIYVAAGLFFFGVLCRERVRAQWLWLLVLLSFPVVVWNAAAGGGKALSLIWLLGALAGCGLARLSAGGQGPGDEPGGKPGEKRHGWLAFWLVLFGSAGLAGRVLKQGFDGYDLQTVALVAAVLFGVLIALRQVRSLPPLLDRACRFFASYSYSLYLIHNTVLVVVFEALDGQPAWLSITVGVMAAHGVALALYLVFERHHRHVARWLRPRFERALQPRAGAVPNRFAASTGPPGLESP